MFFSGGNAVLGSYYGAGSALYTWTDVGSCRGNESKITACKYTTPVLACYSTNHAGVSCYSTLCLSLTECNRRSDCTHKTKTALMYLICYFILYYMGKAA